MRPDSILTTLLLSVLLGGLTPLPLHAQAPSHAPSSAQALADLARQRRKEGHTWEAAALFERALRRGLQDDPHVHLGLAYCLFDAGYFDEALEEYTESLYWFQRGSICERCAEKARQGQAEALKKATEVRVRGWIAAAKVKGAAAPLETAVAFINYTSRPVRVEVDGDSYTIPALKPLVLSRPLGTMTYRVVPSQQPWPVQTRLEADRRLYIEIGR